MASVQINPSYFIDKEGNRKNKQKCVHDPQEVDKIKLKQNNGKASPYFEDLWGDSTSFPSNVKKVLSGIEAIHGGASYNPSQKQYTHALALATVREVSRKENKIFMIGVDNNKGGNHPLTGLSLEPGLEDQLSIVSKPDSEPEFDCNLDMKEQILSKGRTIQRHTTKSKKAAKKRQRLQSLQSMAKKKKKEFNIQIENLSKISKDILLAKKTVLTAGKKQKRKVRAIEKPAFPVCLPSELPSSLRTIPISPLEAFKDRFNQIQQKGLIEVQAITPKKRPKRRLVAYERRSHKYFLVN